MHSRYQLIGRLETGELAELYIGQRDGGAAVAVQLLQPKTSDPRYAKEIANGARALATVQEERFLRYLEVGTLRNRVAVVREHVDGIALADVLQRLPTTELVLTSSVSLLIVIELLEAIDRAHEAGIAHGSLAPSTVMLARSGRVMISELGSFAAQQATPSLKGVAAKGREAYRAPELFREPLNEQMDIYSIGAIAYQLLTRREPQGAGNGTRREALVSPSRVDRRLNGRIDPIILRALESTAARRFRTAKDFATFLRNFLISNGGVPSKQDLQKFTGDALKAISLPLGPCQIVEPFSLAPIEGAEVSTPPDRDHLSVPDFVPPVPEDPNELMGKTDPDQAYEVTARRKKSGAPTHDEGTNPDASGPGEVSWEAPPGAAPPKSRRSNSMTGLPSSRARSPTRNPRLRVIEDFMPGSAGAESVGAESPAEQPQPDPSPADVESSSVSESQAAQPPRRNSNPSLASMTPDTGRAEARAAFLSTFKSRRRRMFWVAGGLGLTAALFIVFVSVWGSRTGAVAVHVDPKPPKPKPADPVANLDDALQKYLSEEEKNRRGPVTPNHDAQQADQALASDAAVEDEPAVVKHSNAFVSVTSDTPAFVWVDGIRLKKKTPLLRFPIEPGERRIVIEALSTHERHPFSLTFQAGQVRKIEENFKSGR